mmetsp:Transcript_243/g.754  ORF Transcript_243/g.754 Transcript_243/m.754 type:complete len:336 (+) Transcript_243:791-1798(+)
MGNFLDTPITDKETDVGEDLQGAGLSYGVSAMQGWRAQMEDDHLHKLGLPDASDVSLFGVYDGHGGDFVAHYVARKFPEHLSRAGTLRGSDADFATTATKAFETALMSIDAELLQQPEVESGQDQSGSTSVMTLISPKHIVCANTGDSRAVLCRAGQAVPLSDDHKPYNPEEKARIEAAGGTVKFNRVNGDLAVSRALGDFVYKRCETVERKAQAVTAFPEVMVEARDSDKDEFVVLACDGIWDVMTSQQVVEKVRSLLVDGRPAERSSSASAASAQAEQQQRETATPPAEKRPWDLGAVCEELIDHCLHLGSRDNMSVLIVLMDQKLKPKPDPA